MDAVGKVIKFAWIPGLVALFGLSYVFMNTDSISKEDTVVDKNYEPAYSFVKPPFQPDPAGYGNFLVKGKWRKHFYLHISSRPRNPTPRIE